MPITNNDIAKIVRDAKSRKNYFLPFYSKSGVLNGTIPIKIRKFKKVGFIMDLDFPFDLEKQFIDKLEVVFNRILEDIQGHGFREKLHIGKRHITVALYLGDEQDALGYILEIIEDQY